MQIGNFRPKLLAALKKNSLITPFFQPIIILEETPRFIIPNTWRHLRKHP